MDYSSSDSVPELVDSDGEVRSGEAPPKVLGPVKIPHQKVNRLKDISIHHYSSSCEDPTPTISECKPQEKTSYAVHPRRPL